MIEVEMNACVRIHADHLLLATEIGGGGADSNRNRIWVQRIVSAFIKVGSELVNENQKTCLSKQQVDPVHDAGVSDDVQYSCFCMGQQFR